MNKRVNTILFILGATVFNIFIAVISFVMLTLVYIRFFMMLIPETSRSWGFSLIFLSAIVISFLVYRFAMKIILNRVDIEKHFDPLFIKATMKKK